MSLELPSLSRRSFLYGAAATALATMATRPLAAQVAPPPGRKLGVALVGIGNLSMNQLLPAFAKSNLCQPVALVSGHPVKASHFRNVESKDEFCNAHKQDEAMNLLSYG